VREVDNPSYLALAPDGRMLYSVNELAEGTVSAFYVDANTGELTFINRVASHGADPAHLSVHPSSRWLLVANYTGSTIATFPILAGGALGEAADVVHHTGSGPNPKRQERAHPHMIVTDPTGAFVLVPDLGLDAVVGYRLDAETGRLVTQPEAGGSVPPGAGPRHLAFGGNGRHAYVLNELASTISVMDFLIASGRLQQTQVVSTLPEDFDGSNTTAAIVCAPSGRFVYASNRGHDSIAAFAVSEPTGQLTPIGHIATGGRIKRDFNIDPTGTYLLAANQDAGSIVSFRIDQASGALEPTGFSVEVPAPVRVVFAAG
jgi:6-phosphogluconolactonase